MVFCDSHAHLASDRFAGETSAVIARAKSAGVTRIVTCGGDLFSSEAERAIAREHTGIYAAVGVHGHEASTALVAAAVDGAGAPVLDEAFFAHLAELADDPAVVAIGEIGLDYHYDLSARAVQRAVFARCLRLAADLGLPVILHNRESDEDLRRIVDEGPRGLRGVLHCFSADRAMAEWALARGLYIGVAGPITFANARGLPGVIRHVPLDRLLIETDSPFLAPHPLRGRRNEPAYVVRVAERLAEVKGITLEQVADVTTANACQLFGLD
jgi:TatD DNase family protein